ncbi:nucleoside triphosphate pyrophosphohydrolase [Vallitaleaceae bacterium 9-2]
MENERYTFEQLLAIMERLRSKDGCPWDKEQTHQSLKSDTIEEAYELVEAINNNDDKNMQEELGDLLLHIAFHIQIAKEENRFDEDDVLYGIIEKMIRRHPHVFGNQHAKNSDEVLVQWDEIKKIEKEHTTTTDVMRSVAKALPALTRASKIQKKAAKVGFDFEDEIQMLEKLDEEVQEMKEAVQKKNIACIEDEIGDLLFQIVNLSRFFGLNAENTLTNATEKFINRFEGIEELAINQQREMATLSLNEMNELWEVVKKQQSF